MGAVLVMTAVMLAVRARDEDRWSLWAFGDATTLMTIRHWVTDGVWHHYGLELNKGYSVFTKLFDHPALLQHAHGNCATGVPGVGPNVYYTHYPSGYLVPFYLLRRAGVTGVFGLRLFSITFSTAAVGVLFLLFRRISSSPIAFFGALFYLTSRMFLGYADSLVEHALDDFLKFTFMHLALSEARAATPRKRTVPNALLWVTALLLYSQSWDSVLFVLIWLLGVHIIELRRIRMVQCVTVASAFGVGLGIQIIQNSQYLGFLGALRDLNVRYLQIGLPAARTRAPIVEMISAAGSLLRRMSGLSHWPSDDLPPWAAVLLLAPLLLLVFRLRRREKSGRLNGFPSWRYLLLLLLCGSAFPVLLRRAAQMVYEGRQMAAFVGLLVATALVYGWRSLRRDFRARSMWKSCASLAIFVVALFLVTAGLQSGTAALNMARPPSRRYLQLGDGYEETMRYHRDELGLVKAIGRRFGGRSNVVVFALNCMPYNSCDDRGRYAEVEPVFEYYAGAPVLSFGLPSLLVEDVRALHLLTDRRAMAYVIVRDDEARSEILALLADTPARVETVSEALQIDGRSAAEIECLTRFIVDNPRYDTSRSSFATADEHIGMADTLSEHGDWRRAVEHYTKALALEPDLARAHTGLGKVAERQGDYDAAAAHYRAALELEPDAFDPNSHLGGILRGRNEIEEAAVLFRRAVAARPRDAEACCDYANALVALGRPADSLRYFLRAIRRAPRMSGAYTDMGRALLDLDRYAEAVEAFQTAIEIDPADGMARGDWANALASAGKTEEALPHFKAAAALAPDNASLRFDWGNTLAERGRHAEALDQFRAAVEIDPAFAPAHVSWAHALVALGRLEEATNHLAKAVSLAPADVDMLCEWGEVLADAKRHKLALEKHRAGLALDAESIRATMGVGRAENAQGNREAAKAAFQRAVELEPGNVEACTLLGTMALREGNHQQAAAYFERAAVDGRGDGGYELASEMDPENDVLYCAWGNLLAGQQKFDDAVARYNQAIAINPDFYDAHLEKGNALAAANHYDRAITALARAVEIRETPFAAFNLGRAYLKHGSKAAGLSWMTRSLELARQGGADDLTARIGMRIDRYIKTGEFPEPIVEQQGRE